MIDLEKFKEKLTHKGGECCDFLAYKIDSADGFGLSAELLFKNGQVSQVDYFVQQDKTIYLIELSDLTDDVQNCLRTEVVIFGDDNNTILSTSQENFSQILGQLPNKFKKKVVGTLWSDVVSEFQQKWLGSIAIIERYFRLTNYLEIPKYQLIIVIKNNQDIKELNFLKQNLSGMMGEVIILKTKQLPIFLQKKMK